MKTVKTTSWRHVLAVLFFIFGILGIYIPIAAAVWGMHKYGVVDMTNFENYPIYRF